jgi:hypothetical protein
MHVGGQRHTFNKLKRRFHIIRPSSMIDKILKNCILCRKKKNSPIPLEVDFAPIPSSRMPGTSPIRAFENIIIDLAGYFMIREKRSQVKRYVLLISDMVFRGLHCEIIHQLDIASFLMGLERFCATRGRPKQIRSDNGTNFVGGETELKTFSQTIMKNMDIISHKYPDIEWSFSCPLAPHTNGLIERLVQSVKKGLAVVKNPGDMNDEMFRTYIKQVEGMINSRPLAYERNDIEDLIALTPADFYNGTSTNSLVPLPDMDVTYQKKWKYVQQNLCQFWERFIEEYITSLNKAYKVRRDNENLQVGDVVAIIDQKIHGQWPLARVEDIKLDQDGKVRKVKLKVNGKMFERNISKLMILVRANEKSIFEVMTNSIL